MGTTAFAVNREALPSDLTILPDWTLPLRRCRDRLRRLFGGQGPLVIGELLPAGIPQWIPRLEL
jgi:hypothetical protein